MIWRVKLETRKKIELALHDAMRANDELRKRTIRLVLASIKNSEIDKGNPPDESGVLTIIQKEVKSRNESISDAQKADRADLILTAEKEIKILEEFLPNAVDEDELRILVQSTITELAPANLADMGKIIKAVITKTQGRATGDRISRVVREYLQK